MKNKILCIFALLLACASSAMAQVKVTGTVVDDIGEPLMAATVQETGTGNGVLTDMDGKFTLTLQSNKHTLTISYVGYKKMVVSPKAVLNLQMEVDNVLNEMVVTGYQVQRKADLTGAVSVVSVDDMKKQNENNPMKALQGKVPGMTINTNGNPAGEASIRIRGIGTLNNNDPLYIIDGVPTKSGMHELNGNDIESIQVLKDAASASIYGSRAANGVIIITTKKGKDGKVNINFDASVQASQYVNRIKTLNARQFGEALWRANVNDRKDPNAQGGLLGYNFDWHFDDSNIPVLDNITMNAFLDDEGTVRAGSTNWFDEITRTGVVQQYNLSVSNGSDKVTSFFSAGYYKNIGTIKTTNFERFSARANNDFKLFNGIVVLGENFTINHTSGVGVSDNLLGEALQFNPNYPVYAENGEFAELVGSYSDKPNPVGIIERGKDNKYSQWRSFGDIHLEINPIKNLKLRTTLGMDYTQKEQRFFSYPIVNGKQTTDESKAEYKQEHWMRWMWNAVASYNLEIGKHRGDAMIGMEINRQNYNGASAIRSDYAVLNTDYMWPSAGAGTAEALGYANGYSLVSFFGKLNYTFDNRYMASFTLRHDGSSRFGKNNKYGTFPSVSVGWRINNEKFMEKTSSWLDDLKLRYSWGQTGNQEIDDNSRYTLYKSSITQANVWDKKEDGSSYDIAGTNGGKNLTSGFVRTQRGNDDLRWETTEQHNIGIDFAFFHSDLYGSFDLFHKKTKDILLFMKAVDAMGEGSGKWINAGEVLNRGLEVQLGYRHHLQNGFSWDITGNISTYHNEITKLPQTVESSGAFGGNASNSVVGHAMWSGVGYVYDGIFQNQEEVDNHATQTGKAIGRMRFKDIDKNGVIDEKDQTWIYNPTPDFSWGLNVYLQYKNWDFTMFWQGVQGLDVNTHGYKARTDFWTNTHPSCNVAFLNKGERVLNAWTPENMSSTIPMLTTADNNDEGRFSSYYIENGSYAKLRNLQIGYTLPKKVVQKICLDRIRLYFSAQNLLTIKAKSFTGTDPETADPNTFPYPVPMTFTFGLNVSL